MAEMPNPTESRAQIADLVHRYAHHVLHRTMSGAEELFHPDMEFVVRERKMVAGSEPIVRSRAVGRAATLEYVQRSTATLMLCPLIHNLLIEIDGRDARSACVMENRTWPAVPGLIGEYDDTFRFEDRWRFATRVYTIFVN